jgi:hypothetical protein
MGEREMGLSRKGETGGEKKKKKSCFSHKIMGE